MKRKRVICLTTGTIYESGVEASSQFGFDKSRVSSSICRSERRGLPFGTTANGFDWCYQQEEETAEECRKRVGWVPRNRPLTEKEEIRVEISNNGLFIPKRFDKRVWEIVHKSEDYKERHPYKIRNRLNGSISYAAEGELV